MQRRSSRRKGDKVYIIWIGVIFVCFAIVCGLIVTEFFSDESNKENMKNRISQKEDSNQKNAKKEKIKDSDRDNSGKRILLKTEDIKGGEGSPEIFVTVSDGEGNFLERVEVHIGVFQGRTEKYVLGTITNKIGKCKLVIPLRFLKPEYKYSLVAFKDGYGTYFDDEYLKFRRNKKYYFKLTCPKRKLKGMFTKALDRDKHRKGREPKNTMKYTFKQMIKYGLRKVRGRLYRIKDGKKVPLPNQRMSLEIKGWDGNQSDGYVVNADAVEVASNLKRYKWTDKNGYFEYNNVYVGEYVIYCPQFGFSTDRIPHNKSYKGNTNFSFYHYFEVKPEDKVVKQDVIIKGDLYNIKIKSIDKKTKEVIYIEGHLYRKFGNEWYRVRPLVILLKSGIELIHQIQAGHYKLKIFPAGNDFHYFKMEKEFYLNSDKEIKFEFRRWWKSVYIKFEIPWKKEKGYIRKRQFSYGIIGYLLIRRSGEKKWFDRVNATKLIDELRIGWFPKPRPLISEQQIWNLPPGEYDIKYKLYKKVQGDYLIGYKYKYVPNPFECVDNVRTIYLPKGYKKPAKIEFKVEKKVR